MTQPDFGAIKIKQQAAWSSGDYAVVGNTIPLMAELLCEALDIRSGWKVLDVAAGNGNATLAAARRGCEVTSTDYVPALLQSGRQRVDSEGWKVTFQEADAENLPFGDEAFDAAISTVGVMFTPNQEQSASEMFRVVKTGGKIGLANWDAGRVCRTDLQNDRQVHSSGCGSAAALAVGDGGTAEGAVPGGRVDGCDGEKLHVSRTLAGALAGGLPQVLRAHE